MDVTAANGASDGGLNQIRDEVPHGDVDVSLTERSSGTLTETTNGTSTEASNGTLAEVSNGTSQGSSPPSPSNLSGKVALVTGASRGIGAGIALELGARKASVIVNYVKGKSAAEEVVGQIERLGSKAIAVQADVSKVPEITKLFDAAKAHFGKIDIVVSNSGTESFDRTEDITEERFDYVFGLNVRAQFFVGQHAYTYCEPGGRLILMSSIAAGLLGVADHSLYSGSKSAVNGITKSFATDFGKKGMTCNAIAPGGVKSDMFTQVAWRYIPGANGSWTADAIESAMANHCPLKRCALPVDVARVVAFLASEDGGWVNGQSCIPFLPSSPLPTCHTFPDLIYGLYDCPSASPGFAVFVLVSDLYLSPSGSEPLLSPMKSPQSLIRSNSWRLDLLGQIITISGGSGQ